MMHRISHQWPTCFLIAVILISVGGCSKKKPDPAMETPETQTASLSAAEKFIKQQEEDKHSADYYKVDNKERVVVEDSIIDDVNANIGDVKANAEKARIIALKDNEASGRKYQQTQQADKSH
ncbi:hypothetical protein [Aquirhabdus parva]|uniref:Uncharacterized protein n=1 Tax=Aquirhabdus parva TaxID=2283318 RepID=A0A345P2Y5_9GAMM|nr:hypothetical protein [Aquirhabdus parva]AXI01644.1 hypothetical protein HYN46_01275 [Aquirhabdus parva]